MLDVETRSQQSDAFESDVIVGLAQVPKTLPSRWLYDDRGSELFVDITKLDEYYPTRIETALLRKHSGEMAAFCGPNTTLLEYGAGSGIKTEILIGALRTPRLYVPIDIAGDFLDQTVARFQWRFPHLQSRAIVADFTAPFPLPKWVPVGARVAFFPGSTVGNLNEGEAAIFLQRMRRHVGAGGKAIIGVDMKKDLDVLVHAYDDAEGVTAEFNLNLLERVNRELDGDFVLDRFYHSARWNASESAIEMHLVSRIAQRVTVSGHSFDFDAGETIHTESSRKYDVAGFTALAEANGWTVERIWSDERGYFSIFGLG